jgi:hypothetical protein
MSKETLYPSQINTKTISCRISSIDYVNFLNDALSKGITLNDWLLLKIYAQNQNKALKNENNTSLGTNNEIEVNSDSIPLPFNIINEHGEFYFQDINDLEDFISNTLEKQLELEYSNFQLNKAVNTLVQEKPSKELPAQNSSKIDLNNKSEVLKLKLQFYEHVDTIKFDSKQDKKDILNDIRMIFSTLFE